jgi:hypothetical protein
VKRALAWARWLACLAPFAVAAETGTEPPVEIGGSFRALAIVSRTPDAQRDRHAELGNRLRIKLGARVAPSLLLRLEHDTELIAGNRLEATQDAREAAQARQVLGGGSTWLRRGDVRGTQQVFRGYAQYTSDALSATFGRQRIPLGAGRFWSTLDMLNPVNPQQIERGESVGVDALLLERGVGSLSRASLVYAPDPAHEHDRWVAQYRTHLRETDLTLTLGRYWQDNVIGVDVATQWGHAGVRGEIAFTRPRVGPPYRTLLLGIDYAFANTLTLSGELYYSDQRAPWRAAQRQANAQLALVQPPGRAYAGLSMSYDVTPLWKVSAVLLANLGDSSRLLYPSISHSLSDNSVLTAGAQFFGGSRDSEYGHASALAFLRYERSF